MGPSETTFTDPLTRSPRPWVEIVSSLYHAAGGAGGPGSPMAAAAGSTWRRVQWTVWPARAGNGEGRPREG